MSIINNTRETHLNALTLSNPKRETTRARPRKTRILNERAYDPNDSRHVYFSAIKTYRNASAEKKPSPDKVHAIFIITTVNFFFLKTKTVSLDKSSFCDYKFS